MAFKFILDEPDLLKDCVIASSSLLNEAVLTVDSNGVSLVSMDSANVALVEFNILAGAFRELEASEKTEFGVNMSDLVSVMRRVKSTETLEMSMDDGMLSIKISGNAKRAFQIPLIDVKKETKIPQLEFPASIEIKAEFLEDGISDAEIISDAVIFEADPDSFKIRSRGDNRTAELQMQKGEDGIVSLEAKDHVKSTFSLDYLKKMIKASKISDVASVKIGNDYPLRMTFTVLDKAHIGFVLAPRIEND